jgi:hypothetical protein
MDAKSISVAAGYVGSGGRNRRAESPPPSEAMQLRSKTDAVSTAILKTACEGSRPRGPTHENSIRIQLGARKMIAMVRVCAATLIS